jgi:uncharacterized protein
MVKRRSLGWLSLITTLVNVGAFSPVYPSSTLRQTRSIWLRTQSATPAAYTNLSPEALWSSPSSDEEPDELFDGRTTVALVGGQSLLIVAAVIAAKILNTPNLGFGPGISFDSGSIQQGVLGTVPIFGVAFVLDLVEKRVPALQDVTIATQRSVMALLGGTFKPGLSFVTSAALGLAAGFGEEMLFRGVLQWEVASRFGDVVALGGTSIVFGLLHAVTPLYAVLAGLASIYFGWLYQSADNLAVPIVTHALYDVGALLWAHWTVTQMTVEEKDTILNWQGPGTSAVKETVERR